MSFESLLKQHDVITFQGNVEQLWDERGPLARVLSTSTKIVDAIKSQLDSRINQLTTNIHNLQQDLELLKKAYGVHNQIITDHFLYLTNETKVADLQAHERNFSTIFASYKKEFEASKVYNKRGLPLSDKNLTDYIDFLNTKKIKNVILYDINKSDKAMIDSKNWTPESFNENLMRAQYKEMNAKIEAEKQSLQQCDKLVNDYEVLRIVYSPKPEEETLRKELVDVIKDINNPDIKNVIKDLNGLTHFSIKEHYKVLKEFVDDNFKLISLKINELNNKMNAYVNGIRRANSTWYVAHNFMKNRYMIYKTTHNAFKKELTEISDLLKPNKVPDLHLAKNKIMKLQESISKFADLMSIDEQEYEKKKYDNISKYAKDFRKFWERVCDFMKNFSPFNETVKSTRTVLEELQPKKSKDLSLFFPPEKKKPEEESARPGNQPKNK